MLARIAFLTLEDRSRYVIDDAIAIEALARRGVRVDEVPWRTRDRAWSDDDAVIIRSTWDYQRDLDGFLATLASIASTGVPLANELDLVRWNARKTYLRDLAQRGVVTLPTRWGEGITPAELTALCDQLDVEECVIKPVVGANADDTFRLPRRLDRSTAEVIARRFSSRAWMAQPFVRSVLDEGERSLFFFDGRLSHAIRKVPRAGDFRVQEEHGGAITPFEPDAAHLEAAERVMSAIGDAPLQARVDLVRRDDGALALMELEAIEPSLYFRMHPRAADNFADALSRWFERATR